MVLMENLNVCLLYETGGVDGKSEYISFFVYPSSMNCVDEKCEYLFSKTE